jgi:hypothetical protein
MMVIYLILTITRNPAATATTMVRDPVADTVVTIVSPVSTLQRICWPLFLEDLPLLVWPVDTRTMGRMLIACHDQRGTAHAVRIVGVNARMIMILEIIEMALRRKPRDQRQMNKTNIVATIGVENDRNVMTIQKILPVLMVKFGGSDARRRHENITAQEALIAVPIHGAKTIRVRRRPSAKMMLLKGQANDPWMMFLKTGQGSP